MPAGASILGGLVEARPGKTAEPAALPTFAA